MAKPGSLEIRCAIRALRCSANSKPSSSSLSLGVSRHAFNQLANARVDVPIGEFSRDTSGSCEWTLEILRSVIFVCLEKEELSSKRDAKTEISATTSRTESGLKTRVFLKGRFSTPSHATDPRNEGHRCRKILDEVFSRVYPGNSKPQLGHVITKQDNWKYWRVEQHFKYTVISTIP